MKTQGLWYFAHPYTVRNKEGETVLAGEEANFRLCCYRSAQLILRGFNIYSPISHTHPIHVASPELLGANEHEMWYELDNQMIDRTHWEGIILAPGWEKSTGCSAERDRFLAKGNGIQILTYDTIINSPHNWPLRYTTD